MTPSPEIKCPLCKSVEYEELAFNGGNPTAYELAMFYGKRRNLRLYACQSCGVVFAPVTKAGDE